MPDFSENNKEGKRSKVETGVYGLAYVLGFLLLLTSFFMVLLSPYMGGGFLSYMFLFAPVFAIAALVGVGFSYKKRSRTLKQISENIETDNLPSEKRIKNYGLRLLIMFGVVFLGFVTLFIITITISSVTNGTLLEGNFWTNVFSFIPVLIIEGIGVLGVFKLIQLLRK